MAEVLLEEVAQIAVTAKDVARATAFYRDVLGLRLLFEAPSMAMFQLGRVRLMVTKPDAPRFEHPASIVYYRVADVVSAVEALRARGVRLEGEPHVVGKMGDVEVWMAFFQDTEDNVLAVTTEKKVR